MKDWITTDKVLIRETSQRTTAVVIKLNSEEGAVRFIKDNQNIGARETDSGVEKKVKMVFLSVGHSCCKIYYTRAKEARGCAMLASIRLYNFHTHGNENRDEWKISGLVWQCNQYFLVIAFFQSFKKDFCALDREWQNSGLYMTWR